MKLFLCLLLFRTKIPYIPCLKIHQYKTRSKYKDLKNSTILACFITFTFHYTDQPLGYAKKLEDKKCFEELSIQS